MIGTDSGLMLLDRSGQGKGQSRGTYGSFQLSIKLYQKVHKFVHLRRYRLEQKVFRIAISVYQLITRRRFEQMTVLEGQNILVTISGRKRRIRVYYLSWLKQKILRTEGVSGVEVSFNLAI